MRVAFDEQIFAIQRYGGISRVFAELARQFIANPELGVELQPVAAPLVNEYILRDPITARALDVRGAKHWAPSIARSMVRRRHKGPADVVHNTFYLPRALSDYPQAKRIVTVHDMIPEILPASRRKLDFLTIKKRYVEKAHHIVCVSESTKKDLLSIYGPIDKPISVVHSGVGPEFNPSAPPLPKWPAAYVLHVGHRGDYKDGQTLLQAFGHVASDMPELTLMLVGGGPLTKSERQELRALGIADRVFQERVPDSQMPSAYANAQIFVFPSEQEGFGLPAVEAMACGVPTILCDSSALPEIGGDAVSYFPRRDVDALANKMHKLLTDHELRIDRAAAALQRATRFTWRSAAEKMAEVYRVTNEESPDGIP